MAGWLKLNSRLFFGRAWTLCRAVSLLATLMVCPTWAPNDVRQVLAALLIQHNRRRRHRVGPLAETVLDVDEDVLQPVAGTDDEHFGHRARTGHALGIRVHRQWPRRWRLAVERDRPADHAGAVGRVGRRGRRLLAPPATRGGRHRGDQRNQHDTSRHAWMIVDSLRGHTAPASTSSTGSGRYPVAPVPAGCRVVGLDRDRVEERHHRAQLGADLSRSRCSCSPPRLPSNHGRPCSFSSIQRGRRCRLWISSSILFISPARLGGDDARAAGVVAVLGGVAHRVAHVVEAAAVHQVDDQLELVQALEVGDLGLVAGLDQRLEARLDERADAAAQHGLLAERDRSRSLRRTSSRGRRRG